MTTWAMRRPVVSEESELPRSPIKTDSDGENSKWSAWIDELLTIRQLEDDWDGQGAPAPVTDVVDSSLILALLMRREGIAAPNLVTQGPSGRVHFDWLPGDGKYVELQVSAPNQAFVYIHTPGLPLRQYALGDNRS